MHNLARLLALLGLISSAAFAQVTFSQTAYTSFDTSSNGVVSGDFNHDGILDLVTINTNSLSFYKGLGGGKYAPAVKQSIPAGFGQVLAADINRDGLLDLVIAPDSSNSNSAKYLLVLLGNGNGTFRQGANIPIGGVYARIALADFNGDHIPDLALSYCTPTSTPTCTAQVLLNNGSGVFYKSATLSLAGGDIVAGDFNADGHQDIAVLYRTTYTSNYVELYLGYGNGTFHSPVAAYVPSAQALAVGDFFGNHIPSLAVLNDIVNAEGSDSDNTYVYTLKYSSGSLVVANHQLLQYGTAVPYVALTAGDLNGDFRDDLALVGGNAWGDADAYIIGNGNGTFNSQQYFQNSGAASNVIIRDLNADSRHDILTDWNDVLGGPGGANVLINTNAPTNCTLPAANAQSIHICAPYNGEVVGSSFTFKASGQAWNGTIKRMELWIDGVKRGQFLEDQFRQTVSLSRGYHTVTFVAVNTFDQYVKASVTIKASY